MSGLVVVQESRSSTECSTITFSRNREILDLGGVSMQSTVTNYNPFFHFEFTVKFLEPCSGGHYLNDQTGCQTCEAGYYSAGGTVSACTKCDADKYSVAGATQCTDCPPGKGVASGEGKQESDCQGMKYRRRVI